MALVEIKHIKLSDLTRQVEETIKRKFGEQSWWIVAEISSHKFYANQDRHYFEFVEKAEGSNDPVAKVRGVAWRNSSPSIKEFERTTGQTFTNGLQVLVKVTVEFHQAYGLSLVLIDIDQSFTLGNLERQRQETLLRLVKENAETIQKVGDEYLTKNKELQLSAVIQNIALIGSPNSEGYTDFTHTIASNQFKYKFKIDIYQSSVQGAASENELINTLIAIYRSGKKYDCVVIIRGGGSKTDFLVFDTYGLSRAIARFPVPVITGIGHHKDVSIVDMMVHTSMKTPTKAAEFIILHNRNFEDAILIMQNTIIIKSQQLLSHAWQGVNASNVILINKSRTFISHYKDNLNNFKQVIINNTKTILYTRQTNLVALLNQLSSKPKIITAAKVTELRNMTNSLNYFAKQFLTRQGNFLNHYVSVVKLMSPDNLLKKGFAIIFQNGKIIKDGKAVSPKDELTITMHDYAIKSTVISKSKNNGQESDV